MFTSSRHFQITVALHHQHQHLYKHESTPQFFPMSSPSRIGNYINPSTLFFIRPPPLIQLSNIVPSPTFRCRIATLNENRTRRFFNSIPICSRACEELNFNTCSPFRGSNGVNFLEASKQRRSNGFSIYYPHHPRKRTFSCASVENSSNMNIELEIFEFMQNSEDPSCFPSRQQLINAGRQDLVDAILKEGGWLTIGWENSDESDSLSSELDSRTEPKFGDGPSKSLVDDLGADGAEEDYESGSDSNSTAGVNGKIENGKVSRFENGLKDNNKWSWRRDKSDDINYDSDKSLDDDSPPDAPKGSNRRRRKPRGYWRNDENLKREVEQYLANHNGLSHKEFKDAGYQDLENAVKRRGGWKVVADLFNINITHFKGVPRNVRGARRKERGKNQDNSQSLTSGKTGTKAEEAPVLDQWNRIKSNQFNQFNRAIQYARSTNYLPAWDDKTNDGSGSDSNSQTIRRKQWRRKRKEASLEAIEATEPKKSIRDSDSASDNQEGISNLSRLGIQPSGAVGDSTPSSSASIVENGKMKHQEEKEEKSEDEIMANYGGDKDKVLMKNFPRDARMVLDRIRALESSLSATRAALQSGRDSLIDEGKKLRESTVAELAKVTDSLEFRESEIMKTRVELRTTKAKVTALEGRLATEFSERRKELMEKEERIGDIESIIYQMRTVKVVWPNPGNEVLLAGSFDGWNNRIKMQKSNAGVFITSLQLYPGKYEIKFIVDGIWRVDPNRQIVYTDDGSENNVFFVV